MPQAGHLYYEERGAGFPLVLLHGHTLDHRMWEGVIPALAAHFRVLAVDLAGHGQSGKGPEGATLPDDLAWLLRHLGLAKAAVCGLSMGGAAAISFTLHYPEMCAALIPVDSALFYYRFQQWPGHKPYAQMARAEGLAKGIAGWLNDPLFAWARKTPAWPRIAEIVAAYPGDLWLGKANPLAPAGRPETERLSEIAAPTLVIIGEHDLPDFHIIARLLTQQIPDARLAVAPDASHMLPMERPEAFIPLVLDFLTPLLSGA